MAENIITKLIPAPLRKKAIRTFKKELEKDGVASIILNFRKIEGADESSDEEFETHLYKDNVYDVFMANAKELTAARLQIRELEKRNGFLERRFEQQSKPQ